MPRGTQDAASVVIPFRLQDYHPLWSAFPCQFSYSITFLLPRSYNPEHSAVVTKGYILCIRLNPLVTTVECSVWAPPLSLATTQGISIDFFSSRY